MAWDSSFDFAPEALHEGLLERAPRVLGFDPEAYFPEWQGAVRRTFRQLLGLMPGVVEPSVRIMGESRVGAHRRIDFVFTAEPGADVPCMLVLPAGATEKVPVVICLQGHSSGFHLSVGEARSERDKASLAGGRDFALQAVSRGYAALCIEQRAFGLRAEQRPAAVRGETPYPYCHHPALVALLLGRTLVGQRVWDVMRAIDTLGRFAEVDAGKVACMGHSGGGTVTYCAAAYDPRITIAMASCSVCTYRSSIAHVNHCADNYLPNILHYLEMADIAGLIAPRPLVVVTGRQDPLFPIAGVEEAFGDIAAIYRTAGAAEACRLVIGEGGHHFYPEQAWQAFDALKPW